jgi:ribosomal protein S18 acetylase RimI-like enzyme
VLKITTEVVYEVRAAARADLHLLLEHRLAMIAEMFPRLSYDAVEEMREPNRVWLERHFGRDFNAYLAYRVHEIAGSAAVLWFDHPPTPSNPGGMEAYILNVYTEPAWRRRGVARNLVDRILTEARSRGVRRVWLRTSDDGRPLYMSMGFADSNYLQLRAE